MMNCRPTYFSKLRHINENKGVKTLLLISNYSTGTLSDSGVNTVVLFMCHGRGEVLELTLILSISIYQLLSIYPANNKFYHLFI